MYYTKMKQSVYIINSPPSWIKTAPLALAYLRTYLASRGCAVVVSDLNRRLFGRYAAPLKQWLALNDDFERRLFARSAQEFSEVFSALYQDLRDADIIGFSVLKRNFPFARELALRIREKYPSKKIVFGGPHALYLDARASLDERFSWVIGEGECALDRLAHGAQESVIRFEELSDLDRLPFLDFGELVPSEYSNVLPMLTARGCPHHCDFCTERTLYRTFRHHSARYVVDQIEYLSQKHSTRNFVFLDSMINYSSAWLYEFCTMLIARGLKISWEAQMRIVKDFPVELGLLMKQSGCFNLFVGLESGCDEVLVMMNKGFTTGEALDHFESLSQAGLHFEISLIFGFPGETDEHFACTLDFIARNKGLIPKIAQANPYVDYTQDAGPSTAAPARMDRFLTMLKKENIRFTRSFINNLVYP